MPRVVLVTGGATGIGAASAREAAHAASFITGACLDISGGGFHVGSR